MNNEPRQKILETLGESGCYLLCIIYIAEKIIDERIDAVVIYNNAVEKKFMEPNCLILDAAKIMSLCTDWWNWTKRHEPKDYMVKEKEFEILKYQRKSGAGTIDHFVVGDGKGGVEYDPYGSSRTVRDGVLESKRIFVEG